MVVRKSGPVSGLPGAVAIDTSSTLTSQCQMNDVGQLFYDVTLSPTQGTPPAVPSNNLAYLVHTPGAGAALLVREGDVAPNTGGRDVQRDQRRLVDAGLSTNSWQRNGQTIFVTELRGGDVVGTTNDRAIYLGGTSGLTRVVRKGDAATGTDGVYSAFRPRARCSTATAASRSRRRSRGGTTTTANDTGIWTGTVGALTLALREGTPMPGTGGSLAGNLARAAGVQTTSASS
jgi:hypothetical protein